MMPDIIGAVFVVREFKGDTAEIQVLSSFAPKDAGDNHALTKALLGLAQSIDNTCPALSPQEDSTSKSFNKLTQVMDSMSNSEYETAMRDLKNFFDKIVQGR